MQIFIAGKIDKTEECKDRFAAVEVKILEAGHTPYNPITLGTGYSRKFHLDHALKKLAECDAVYLMEGSYDDAVARLEADYAELTGLPMFHETTGGGYWAGLPRFQGGEG